MKKNLECPDIIKKSKELLMIKANRKIWNISEAQSEILSLCKSINSSKHPHYQRLQRLAQIEFGNLDRDIANYLEAIEVYKKLL